MRFLIISSTSAAKSESIDDDLCPSSHWGHHTGKVAGGFRLRDVDDIVRHSRLAMSVRVFSTPAHNASVRALVRVSRPAWLILPFASSQIKYSLSIRMTLGSGELVNKFGKGATIGVVPYDDALRLPSTSTLPANTSWRPCTDRALMSEIQSIWVNFERKADSPNC